MNGAPDKVWYLLFAFVLPVAALGAVPVSFLLRWLYRRSVRGHMRAFSAPPHYAAGPHPFQPPRTPTPAAPPPPLSIEVVEPDARHALSEEAAELYRLATRTPHRAAAGYALAGVAHAAVATAVLFLLQGFEFFPYRTLTVVFALAWPVVPTVAAVAVSGRRLKVLAPVLFVAVTFVLLLPASPEYRRAFGWILLTQALVPSALMLLVANRRLRSVGPPVLVFLSALVFGLLFSIVVAEYVTRLGPGSETAALLTVPAVTAIGALAAAALVARAARRYARKRESDQMVMLNLYWLLYTEWQCLLLATAVGLWAAAGLLAYAAYRVVLWAALRPLRGAAERRGNVRLLLLRVFGSRERSERAFEELGLRWRYVGSIRLIAGEDLATASLEPHEFLDFLTGRLGRHFVKSPSDLERKIQGADVLPDPDGRFRVNEFFCHEDTWRESMTRLAGEGEVVLMDLRGFRRPEAGGREAATRGAGVSFELKRLVDVKRTRHIVLTFDETTDDFFVREILEAAWAGMSGESPNRRAPADPIRLLRLGGHGRRDTRQLLSMLCAAARPGRGE